MRVTDPRNGQLSPQQARNLWRLATSGRTSDLAELRNELAALSPGWADMNRRRWSDDDQ